MELTKRELVAGLLAAPLFLPGCTRAATSGAALPTGAPATAPLIVAGATMTLEIAPVFLAMRDRYPGGPPVMNGGVVSLIAEQNPADLATNAETQLLRQSVKRPDLRIVMTLVEGLYRIVARRSAGITSLEQLRGKRIATLRATSADYFLAKMLEKGGMTAADVTVVNMNPLQNMAPAITAGEIDAVAIWEPFSENCLRALGSDAIEFSGEGVYRELFNINTTAGALADPVKRREIVAFLRAVINATERMNRDPAEAQALIAQSGGYTLEEVVHGWPHHDFTAGFADNMLDVLEDEERWLAAEEKRQPRSRAQLAPLVDRSVYEEARRG
jgi:NitT/TauT family transport system substrate-binding protein